jgi:hypothetical protein
MMDDRPQTLHEVSLRTLRREQPFDPALREFLDTFYAKPEGRLDALRERPELIDAVHDAYLAAVAEHLARVFSLPVPEWSETHGFALSRPFFAGGLESLKAVLTVESPTAFRRRLLFVSKDALSRPRLQRNATFTTS